MVNSKQFSGEIKITKMHIALKKLRLTPILLAVFLLFLPTLVLVRNNARAGILTTTYLRPFRMQSGQTAKMRLQFRTVSSGATALTVDMDGADSTKWSGNSGSVHSGAMTSDITTCASETGDTGLPGTLTITGASNHTISITGISALSATTTYCIDFINTDAVTLPTANEYHPTITEGSGATDSTTVSVDVISQDSIVITAVVPPLFNMSFDSTATDPFTANLSSSGITSNSARTITLNTNAASGWILWAKSTNGTTKGSLQSAFAGNYKITSPSSIGSASHTPSNNTDDYGLGVTTTSHTTGTGTITVPGAYDGSTANKIGVLDSQNFQSIASSNGTANGDTVTFLNRATVSNITPAANDYTDTVTFIGAGNF